MTLMSKSAFSVTNYYVSGYGDDTNSGLTPLNALKTIEGVRQRMVIDYPSLVVTDEVHINIDGDILLNENVPYTVNWNISGTDQYPIIFKGTSGYFNSSINRATADLHKRSYMITFSNCSYVNINELTFNEATVGLYLNGCDHFNISNNRFIGNTIFFNGGAGAITLSRNLPSQQKTNNCIITHNYLLNNGRSSVIGFEPGTSISGARSIHAIYPAHSNNNKITYNTIITPPGSGIHFYHGYSQNNTVYGNVIDICYGENTVKPGFNGIILGACDFGESGCRNVNDGDYSTVFGNSITNNHVAVDRYALNTDYASYQSINSHKTPEIIVNNALTGTNVFTENFAHHATYHSNSYSIDPYWIDFDPKSIESRTVCGDFDGDGLINDIVALKQISSSEAELHFWQNAAKYTLDLLPIVVEGQNSFLYKGVKWTNSGSYDLSKINGRVVAGDFDGDGDDDIAALYDYGLGNSRVHVWKNNSGVFHIQTWWINSGSYNASMVADRFVSFDFNNDGKDDLAAMYDHGGGSTSIHVWKSNGTAFSVSTPYTAPSYTASNATGKFVAGDFDADGYKDDLAAMYNHGGGSTSIHTWRSTGVAFNVNTWWTSSSYDSDKIKGRLVTGDFNNSGTWDLAAMYDDGGGNTKIHWWSSNTTSFLPNESPNVGWTSSSYTTNSIGTRFMSGQFNVSNHGYWGVLGFYDYSNSTMTRTRTHAWLSNGVNFEMASSSLGFPWLPPNDILEIYCNNYQPSFDTIAISKSEISNKYRSNIGFPNDQYIKLYPNPIQDKFKIEFNLNNTVNYDIQIIDNIGRTFYQSSRFEGRIGINSKTLNNNNIGLAPGNYTLIINIDQNTPLTTHLSILR